MPCPKKRYETRKEAKKQLKLINHDGGLSYKLTDVYFCEDCSGWHTTSISKRDSRQMKKMKRNE